MKTIFASTMLLLVAVTSFSQVQKDISTEIKGATLFPDRAQLTRESSFTVSPGQTILRISSLSPFMDPSSVQVRGEGDFTIVSVNSRMNYLENPEDDPSVSELRNKIRSLVSRIEDERTAIEVLREKEAFLAANRVITGSSQGITAEQYRSMTDLYVAGIESAKTGMLKSNRNLRELEAEKQKLDLQLNGLVNRSRMPSGELLVTVSATRQVNGRLSFSYLVTNAGWYPSYDIRVDEIDSPASIFYKANAWQNSGIDWKNIKTSFSNATPSVSGNIPLLNPWFINFYQPQVRAPQGRSAGMAPAMAKSAQAYDEVAVEAAPEFEAMPSRELAVSVSEAATSFTFDVEMPQTILSDGKVNIIELQRLTTEASYKYRSIPKLREEAFLAADISDWESLNLLDGEANIYFGNIYTGKTFLSASQLSDTLNVSLGIDNGITVKREKRTEFTSTRLLGANRQETRSFLITIRNNKNREIAMTLYDQVPVSQNNSINVEVTEMSGGKHDEATGEVRWEARLGAKQSREFVLTYTVKYPKDKKVILE